MNTHLIIDETTGLVVDAVVGSLEPAPGFVCVVRVGSEWIGWKLLPDGTYVSPGESIDLIAYAAARRWEIIESTRLDIGGCSVPTDKTTRDTLTAGYVKASANPSYQITDWKVGPGTYVTLTAPEIIAIADAVEAHVQVMFSRNRIADEAIEGGLATTTAHVDSILAGNAP